MTKKEIERYHLELFRETCPDFPSGTIVDSEEPDFLVENGSATIGIELTEMYREAPESGRPMQASEKLTDGLVEEARSIHDLRGGPVLTVRAEFDLGSKFGKARRSQVASNLADLVLANCPDIGDEVKLENNYDDLDVFPEEITRIRIQRSPYRSRSLWTAPHAAFIPSMDVGILQERIDEKNKRAAVYRKRTSEIWLVVIYNLSLSLASSFERCSEAFQQTYRSDFDRTFMLDAFGRSSVELTTVR
ncbi:MAG TPA: hypothetical protein VNO50_04990 [Pyrinomonadaceae bacterium]|nr:hypothetical protein [Pyrinomonadaceae bacterium]